MTGRSRKRRERRKHIDSRRVALKRRHRAALRQRRDAEQMRRLGVALRRRLRPPDTSPQLVAPERPEVVTPEVLPRLPVLPFADPDIMSATSIEVFNSLEEARAATADAQHHELLAELRNSQEDERSGIGLGLAIGLSVVAVLGLGVVLCYVLFRRKDGELGASSAPMPLPMPYPYPIPQLGTHQAVIPAPETALVPAAAQILQHFKKASRDVNTYMKSFTLPFIGDIRSEPVRVATAGNEPYEVVVRVVEPPGGQAVLSFEPNELNPGPIGTVSTLTTDFSQFPLGDVLIVPAGQFQIIRLRPKQGLFAKGTVAQSGSTGVTGVVISVTGADFVVGF